MKINVLAIIGIAIVVAFVILGFVWSFDQAWILEVVGISAGLGLVIGSGVEKLPTGQKWRGFLIGGGLSVGAMLAVIGGITESTLTTIIGAVVVVAAAVFGVIMGQRE